jgi:hypothetical protein
MKMASHILIEFAFKYNCKYCSAKLSDKKLHLLQYCDKKMDLNQRPQRKKNLPLRLQDLKETSGSKRPAKSKKMGIDNNPEEKKIKIHDVKDVLPKETEVSYFLRPSDSHLGQNWRFPYQIPLQRTNPFSLFDSRNLYYFVTSYFFQFLHFIYLDKNL